MSKNILITGAKGQLGQDIHDLVNTKEQAVSDSNFYFTDRDSLDITHDPEVREFIEVNNIDTIVNCAAYTAVDKAEEDKVSSDLINHKAVKTLAELAYEKDIWLLHISTDYVFDGKSYSPIGEDEQTSPQGEYGKSKLAGEDEIRRIKPPHAIIIRTSWVYSSFGNNFVKTMLNLGQNRDEINVVSDQIGTPTYARDLARTILLILEQKSMYIESNISANVRTYHYSNEGACSWYDFAQAIFELTNTKCKVNPIDAVEYPTPAKRPYYSVLSKNKIKNSFNLQIPYWRDALKECIGKFEMKA